MIDFAGHIGEILLVFGTFRVARGDHWGFIWRVLGSAIWLVIGWHLDLSSVWFWCGVFLLVDSYGVYKAKHPPRGIR